MKVVRCLVFFIFLTLMTGCTNSEWVLSTFYNRVDNIIANETNEYADFTPAQKEAIDLLADQYHQWHRTEHLPLYADILLDVNEQLQPGESVSRDEVARWSAQIEGFAREMAECYPLNNAFDLMRNLSDEQVDQIRAHGIEEYEEFLEERVKDSGKDRIELRYKETIKWFRRVKLNLDDNQRQHLLETIRSERLIRPRDTEDRPSNSSAEDLQNPERVVTGIELWRDWTEEFVDILEQRESAEFEQRVGQHLQRLWSLQDDNFPEVIEFNRQLWITYFFELAESQTEEQRQEFSSWLVKMASNLNSISARVTDSANLPPLGTTEICKSTIENRIM